MIGERTLFLTYKIMYVNLRIQKKTCKHNTSISYNIFPRSNIKVTLLYPRKINATLLLF